MKEKSAADKRREGLRTLHWPNVDCWTGEQEKGWFYAPRTLPLVLALLSNKSISGNKNPSAVYLELLSRHRSEGIIEMEHESSHAFASGYVGTRAIRTWQERMQLLEDLGFIATVKIGNQRYQYVAVVHPTTAVQRLRDAGKVDDHWWNAYITMKAHTQEATHDQREERKGKVVMLSSRLKKPS